MIDFYREVPVLWSLPENVQSVRLRWVKLKCDSPVCHTLHRQGVLGLTICDVERWTQLVVEADTDSEGVWEDTIAELPADSYIIVAATLGLEWKVLTYEQLMRQASLIHGLPPTATHEMVRQGPEAMLRMRRLVGTDVAAMLPLLNAMGRYVENIGGERLREDWVP